MRIRSVLVIGLLFLDFCATHKAPRSSPQQPNVTPVRVQPMEQPPPYQLPPMDIKGLEVSDEFEQVGIASWYGPDFHGKTTSNGEVYDMHKLTAAHQTLPFNTLVEVENLENGKKTLVRINDRGPFVKNRIIDLSFKAATSLDMHGPGTAMVRLRILKPVLDEVAKPVFSVGYFLQCGAFAEKVNADFLLTRLQQQVPGESFLIRQEGELFKVVSRSFSDKKQATILQSRLEALGFDSFLKESL